MRTLLKSFLAGMALSVSLSTLAWADGEWQGAWDTSFGQLRLIEDGDIVYGDYANTGTIEGVISPDRRFLRAIYRRDDGGYGYVEFRQSGGDMGGLFDGRYKAHQNASGLSAMPIAVERQETGISWTGRQTDYAAPPLIKYDVANKPGKKRPAPSANVKRAFANVKLPKTQPRPPTLADIQSRAPTVFASWVEFDDYEGRVAAENAASKALSDKKTQDARRMVAETKRKAAEEQRRREVAQKAAEEKRARDAAAAAAAEEARLDALYADSDALRERLPILKAYPRGFEPRWIEVAPFTLKGFRGPDINNKFYGLVGIYAWCHSATGKQEIKPFGGLPNRVSDTSREHSRISASWFFRYPDESRRFEFDRACLTNPENRLSIEFKTNIKERDLIRATDDVYGYRSVIIYMDELKSDRMLPEFMGSTRRMNGYSENGKEFAEDKGLEIQTKNDHPIAIGFQETFGTGNFHMNERFMIQSIISFQD